jgi:hypothetical protein
MKDDIDYKTKIALDYAEDAKNSLTLLIEMLESKHFFPRAQQYIQDVLVLMGEVSRELGQLQVMQNIHDLTQPGKEQE